MFGTAYTIINFKAKMKDKKFKRKIVRGQKMGTKIKFEDFDSIDVYLDTVIYEARREYLKNKKRREIK